MRGRRGKLGYTSRINKFRQGKNEKPKKLENEEKKEERQGSKEVPSNEIAELVRKAAIGNVVKDKKRLIDTNVKF
jgi:hypothetical protein